MEYSKLVAVTGLPGLFELINSKTDGAIVRSLEDKSTRFVSSRVHSFSHLESIEIYTQRDNVNLVDVLHAMDKAGGSLPSEKDPAAIKKYFEKVYPDMDFERVYASDMKKMVKWFDQLKKNNIEIKLTEIPEEEPAEPVPAPKTEPVKEEKKAVKKTKTTKETAEEAPAKPAAKAARSESGKKTASKEKEEAPKKKAAPKKK
jgi:hypothetical protein